MAPDTAASEPPDLDRIERFVERLVALDVSEAAVQPIRDWVRELREVAVVTTEPARSVRRER